MKIAAYAAIGIILSWTALAIAQLWFQVVSAGLFVKLTVTAALLLIAVVVAALIHREYSSDKDMKNRNYID